MRDVAWVAVEPAFGLDEIEEEDARECGECERVAVDTRARSAEPFCQPVECATKGTKETWRDDFARQHFADSERQRQRGLAPCGREAFERGQRRAGRTGDGDGRHTESHGTSPAHKPERLAAE